MVTERAVVAGVDFFVQSNFADTVAYIFRRFATAIQNDFEHAGENNLTFHHHFGQTGLQVLDLACHFGSPRFTVQRFLCFPAGARWRLRALWCKPASVGAKAPLQTRQGRPVFAQPKARFTTGEELTPTTSITTTTTWGTANRFVRQYLPVLALTREFFPVARGQDTAASTTLKINKN